MNLELGAIFINYMQSFGLLTGESVNFEEGDQIDLGDLVPDLVPYYTYKGSLTTPNCYESVQWIIAKSKIHVTSKQVNTPKE